MATDPLVTPLSADPEDYMALGVEQMQAHNDEWQPLPSKLDTWILEADSQFAAALAEVASNVLTELTLKWGQIIGVNPNQAVPATATTTWVLADTLGHTIDAGTPIVGVDDNGVEYPFETVAQTVVAPGSGTAAGVQVIAQEAGEASNGISGTAQPAGSLTWLSSITFDAASDGGEDAETVDDFLPRLGEELELLHRAPVKPGHFATMARRFAEVWRALVLDGYDPTDNEKQTITGTATGGTGTLTFNGQTTSALAYNASAATIQAALEALATPTPGDFIATGGPLGTAPVVIEFVGRYRNTDVPAITAGTGSLTGGTWTPTTTRTVVNHYNPDDPATWAEKVVAIYPMAEDGTDVSPATLSALDEFFNGSSVEEAVRERGFIVHLGNPDRITAVTVAFSHTTWQGYEPADVTAAAEAVVESWGAAAVWGVPQGGDTHLWENERVVRLADLYSVLKQVDGLRVVTALTVNGGSSDVTLAGNAPVPASIVATGTAV